MIDLKNNEVLKQALSRVCDDAERWNANWAMNAPSGFAALKIVRTYMKAEDEK